MTPKTLLGYIRKSVVLLEDTTASPARQRAAILRAAGQYPVEFYEDLDLSGRYEANRPGWQALLARLDDPDVAGVVVESYDRSHRNVKEFLNFYDNQLAPRNLALISTTQNLDLSTTDGRLMGQVVMAFAEAESRRSGDRMVATIKYGQEVKGQHFGRFPFGCDRDPKTKHLIPSERWYWLDPITGDAWADDDLPVPARCEPRYYFDALRSLFDLYAHGSNSCADVARLLNLHGWRHWSGSRSRPQEFHHDMVREILRLWPLYAGELPPPRNKRARRRAHLAGGHEPILPVELCQQVGQTMRLRARLRGSALHPQRTYLLTGLLYCADCGHILAGQSYYIEGRIYYYYRHRYAKKGCGQKMMAAEVLEGQVIEGLKNIGPEILEQVAAELRLVLRQAALEPNSPLAQLDERQAELERLVDLRVSGLITKEQFLARQRPLEAEIERLKNHVVAPLASSAEIEETVAGMLAMREHLERADSYLLKEIVYNLFERLEARDGQIVEFVPRAWARPILRLNCVTLKFIPNYTPAA